MAEAKSTGAPAPVRTSSNYKHGCSRGPQRGTPEYRTWCYIITRCYNPNAKCYRYYGARGVTMCDRWRNSFEAFLADVGERPSDKHSIERRDTNGNYEPGNVRWATKKEQMRNTTRNRLLTLNGRTQCVAAWAEELGIAVKVLEGRLRLGWSDEETLTTPKFVPMTDEQRAERRREYERKRASSPKRRELQKRLRERRKALRQ